MRLINIDTLELEQCDDRLPPEYAILSHTWGTEEVTFQDWNAPGHGMHLKGFGKIAGCCKRAREKYHLNYAWVDTCCIDKTSSADLTEAINSMYRYYRKAHVCIVFLADVPGDCPCLIGADSYDDDHVWKVLDTMCSSRWFTRGWTLQELIAPSNIEFYGTAWNKIAALHEAPVVIEAIARRTGLPRSLLLGDTSPSDWSVATRMSWAAHRQTTRVEDEAYCLLGIFDVSLPMIYGDRERAFLRLQEEIIRRSTDHSIFVWNYTPGSPRRLDLLASSPADFAYAINNEVVQCYQDTPDQLESFEVNNLGLNLSLPVVKCRSVPQTYHAVLNCRFRDHETKGPLAVTVTRPDDEPSDSKPRHSQQRTVFSPGHLRAIGDGGCFAVHTNRFSVVPEEQLADIARRPITILRKTRQFSVSARPTVD